MPWTRLDDRFHSNPKILGLSHQAFRLYVVALNWSVSELTDGRIPIFVPPMILPLEQDRGRSRIVAELENLALWKPNPDGWEIHDFDHYQETSAKVQERRSKWTAEKRGQRQVSATDKPPDKTADIPADSKPDPVRTGVPIPIPKTEAKASMRQHPRNSEDPEQINRDGIWTALEDLFGKAATRTERSLRGKLVKSLAEAGASYSQVKERSAQWPKLFPGRNGESPPTLTSTALEKWWSALGLLVATEELRVAPCSICDSRRIVGFTKEGEVVKVDDPRAVVNDRCVCVAK